MELNCLLSDSGEMALLSVADSSALVPSDVSALSLDFKVLHPVVITQLGVFLKTDFRGNVTVQLFQVDQEVKPGTSAHVMMYNLHQKQITETHLSRTVC